MFCRLWRSFTLASCATCGWTMPRRGIILEASQHQCPRGARIPLGIGAQGLRLPAFSDCADHAHLSTKAVKQAMGADVAAGDSPDGRWWAEGSAAHWSPLSLLPWHCVGRLRPREKRAERWQDPGSSSWSGNKTWKQQSAARAGKAHLLLCHCEPSRQVLARATLAAAAGSPKRGSGLAHCHDAILTRKPGAPRGLGASIPQSGSRDAGPGQDTCSAAATTKPAPGKSS
jgi:hypothetical protein